MARSRAGKLVALFVALSVVFFCLALVEWSVTGSEFFAGFLLGAAMAALAAALFWAVDHSTGSQNAKFGTYGEEATAEVFRSRVARRDGWEIVHNVPFDRGDIDHVAFGPAGVLAIESKWANHPWRVHDGAIEGCSRDPLEQAWRGARKIRLLLRGAGIETAVVPTVIQWGPGGLADVDWAYRWFDGGVLVLRGDRSKHWVGQLETLAEGSLETDQFPTVRAALEARIVDHVSVSQ